MSDIRIIYCKPCGYLRKAEAAAAALQTELGVRATLEAGKAGIFEVRAGEDVLLKRTRAWFPAPEDVVAAVRLHVAGKAER